jgi:hypothetical protein
MNTSVEGLSLVTVIALIRKEIAESRAVGKAGNDGKQGAKGDRGPKGDSGPAGRQGPKGNDGKQGKPGKDGPVGEDGTNGVGIQDIEQDIDGAIVVTMTDGEIYTLELPTGGDTTQVHYKVGGGGGGESGSFEVTTDKVKTRSDIIFRDAKGRYKSTKNIPELKNQLEVNRWFVEQLESIESGEIDLPEMTTEADPNTLVLRGDSGETRLDSLNTKNLTLTHGPQSHTEDTWFCSGGETSTHGIKKNTAEGFRASLNVYSKDEASVDKTPNTLALRDDQGNCHFNLISTKSFSFKYPTIFENKAEKWFLSGGESSTDGVRKNNAIGMRASLNVYSKEEVNALSGGDSFFRDIGDNNIEYFGDQLWVTSLRDPFFIGAKIGSDSEFTGTVTANKFVGDGSGLTGTVSAKALAEAFGDIQAALADEKTVAGLKKALTNSLGGLIERLGEAQ